MDYRFYADRRDAGRRLAPLMSRFAEMPDTLVLGLPRGGVVVAYEVAAALHLPLDVLVVRKLGHPSYPEYAMGAIASGDVLVTNPSAVEGMADAQEILRQVAERETTELHRRERVFRGEQAMGDVSGRTVLLIDDGMATGATMKAAVQSLRKREAQRCVVGVPVASQQALEDVLRIADEVICPLSPPDFRGVGQFYTDFTQTADDEVVRLLRRAVR